MIFQIVKILLTAVIIALISYIGKRYTAAGAILASLPLTSLLAIIWLYVETGDLQNISKLSGSIFWMVIPSLIFFIALPIFIKLKMNFWLSLGSSSVVTFLAYTGFMAVLSKMNIKL